jgi:hypothetical protein
MGICDNCVLFIAYVALNKIREQLSIVNQKEG